MEFQGDILDEFLQQQKSSRQSDQPPPWKEEKPEPMKGQDHGSPEADDSDAGRDWGQEEKGDDRG